nr:MAG TPA: hypothetical protein [Caudoviricetes sp.]
MQQVLHQLKPVLHQLMIVFLFGLHLLKHLHCLSYFFF